MHQPDPETAARTRRVQELCHELAQLFTVSLEKRRAMDRLLAQLEQVTRRACAPLRQTSQSDDPTRRDLTQRSE